MIVLNTISLLLQQKLTDALNENKRFEDMIKAAKLLQRRSASVPLLQDNVSEMLRPTVHDMVQNSSWDPDDFKEVYD